MGNINPADICYVEAHGTGTVAGDGQEMDAIDRWYGRAEGRAAPLLIGSVKSNMGHCEGASCLASESLISSLGEMQDKNALARGELAQ
jgi:acyl transferase domain-containing protein